MQISTIHSITVQITSCPQTRKTHHLIVLTTNFCRLANEPKRSEPTQPAKVFINLLNRMCFFEDTESSSDGEAPWVVMRQLKNPIGMVKEDNSNGTVHGVRINFEARKKQQLDLDIIKQELREWKCDNIKCQPCLSVTRDNPELQRFVATHVFTLRKATFQNQEQQMWNYMIEQLQHCPRKSHSTLQYIVSGHFVCRKAWGWAQGFASSTLNRAHSELNKSYARSNPALQNGDKKLIVPGFVANSSRILTAKI